MNRGHFSGFDKALLDEDMVVQASMGPIVDRSKEHLRATDVGVVHARRKLLEELAAFELGEQPAEEGKTVRPLDIVTDAGYTWRVDA